MDLKNYLKYRLVKSFKETIEKNYFYAKCGQYPENIRTSQQIKDYVNLQAKICSLSQRTIPSAIESQIDELVKDTISSMKQGCDIGSLRIKLKSDKRNLSLFSEEYEKMIFDKQGYIDYYVKIDLDLEKNCLMLLARKRQYLLKLQKKT